jgi:hypothetical protein
MPGFLSWVGRVGSVPADVRAELEPEGIILIAEKVRVRQRFSGSVPGRHDGLGISGHTGFVVCTGRRLYASIPTLGRLTEPAIDQAWDATQQGPAKVAITETGVTLTIDLKRVAPRFSGEMTETFATDLGAELLTELPAHSLAFRVCPKYVFHSLGVRSRT